MKKLSLILGLTILLAGCGVDTTGLSEQSSRGPTGNPNALVTVTEYGDLQCPACKSAYDLINKPLLAQYGDKIRFEFKHFPLQTIHEHAMEAAQAAECAADQGKFWEFLDTDYEHQADLSSGQLRTWAGDLKLDTALFDRCVSSGIKQKTVQADYDEGEAKGVNSTPTYYVNGQKTTDNSLTSLSAAIDAALKQGSSVPL